MKPSDAQELVAADRSGWEMSPEFWEVITAGGNLRLDQANFDVLLSALMDPASSSRVLTLTDIYGTPCGLNVDRVECWGYSTPLSRARWIVNRSATNIEDEEKPDWEREQ